MARRSRTRTPKLRIVTPQPMPTPTALTPHPITASEAGGEYIRQMIMDYQSYTVTYAPAQTMDELMAGMAYAMADNFVNNPGLMAQLFAYMYRDPANTEDPGVKGQLAYERLARRLLDAVGKLPSELDREEEPIEI